MDPVAISITHDGGKVSHLSEGGACELLELMRAAIAGAAGDERATLSVTLASTKGDVRREWGLANARTFADGLERALALREAARRAKGQPIGKIDRVLRDPVTLEVAEIQTVYQY